MAIVAMKGSADAFVGALESCKTSDDHAARMGKVQKVQDELVALIEKTQAAAEGLGRSLEENQGSLQNTVREHSTLTQQVTVTNSELQHAREKQKNQQSRVDSLAQQVRDAENEATRLRNRIREEETKRTDAKTDWIPGVGLIGGLVTGRYKRMIPGYSVVAGIISAIKHDLEEVQKRINRKNEEKASAQRDLKSARERVTALERKKSDLAGKVAGLEKQKQEKDQAIVELGKRVTSIQQTREEVLSISSKYDFLGIKCNQLGKIVARNKPSLEAKQVDLILVDARGVQGRVLALTG